MRFNNQQAATRLRELAEAKFRDPITNLPAHNEIQLSAALAVLHNWGQIDWKRVTLRPASETGIDQTIAADQVIASDSVAFCEYPLFFSTPLSREESQWAQFRADILFFAKDKRKIAYVENKIGTGIRKDLIEGAVKCLEMHWHFERACFILLSGFEFIEHEWYAGEMKEVLSRISRKNVSAHIMYWEDIFKACAAA